MKNLTDLIKRISTSLDKKTLAKESVKEVIKNRIGVTIPVENISIKSDEGILELTSSPAVKNEIALKETLILSDLSEVYNLKIRRILYK